MISTTSSVSAHIVGPFDNAPASLQSARGESANNALLRTEQIAAFQANAPLFDQQVQLEDRSVAARASAMELAVRLEQRPEKEQASAISEDQEIATDAESRPARRVEESSASFEDRNNENESMRHALEAYTALEFQAPQSRIALSI